MTVAGIAAVTSKKFPVVVICQVAIATKHTAAISPPTWGTVGNSVS